jgi:hypothetical protein
MGWDNPDFGAALDTTWGFVAFCFVMVCCLCQYTDKVPPTGPRPPTRAQRNRGR